MTKQQEAILTSYFDIVARIVECVNSENEQHIQLLKYYARETIRDAENHGVADDVILEMTELLDSDDAMSALIQNGCE